jgi:hypothetical protein
MKQHEKSIHPGEGPLYKGEWRIRGKIVGQACGYRCQGRSEKDQGSD